MTTVRAGLYLRISEDQTGEGLGIARQRAECLALCERRGWTVVEEFPDNDVSATTGPRPQYERMLEAIRDGVINAVVVWDLDRLSRQPAEIEAFIVMADKYDLQLASVGGDVDLSTDNGRLFARIKGAVARAEIERKSARQKAANRQAIAAGKPTGGPRAFGYTADGLHLNEAEAPLAAEMFRMFNAESTLGDISRWLNSKGVLTPQGNEWTPGSVRQILINPRFAGIRGVRKLRTDERGKVLLTKNGKPSRSQWYTDTGIRAVWPAIVDEATWRAAIERLDDPERRKHYRGRERKYLLPGIARCGWTDPSTEKRCDQPLKTGTQSWGRVLKCPSFRHVNRRADTIEDYVLEVVWERLRRDDAIDLVQPPAESGPDLRALQDEADAIRERRKRQAKRYAVHSVTEDEYDAFLAETGKRLAEIESAIADAGKVNVLAAVILDPRDPEEVWQDLTLSVQRAVVDALMVVRVLSGRLGRPKGGQLDVSTVDIEWRNANPA